MTESTISPTNLENKYSSLSPIRVSFLITRTIYKDNFKDMYFIDFIVQCNQISAAAYNRKLDVIVTADTGEDSMLVVWDVNTGTPRKTIFNPHPDGVLALDINEDGTLIVTLSKAATPTQQVVTLWKWQDD